MVIWEPGLTLTNPDDHDWIYVGLTCRRCGRECEVRDPVRPVKGSFPERWEHVECPTEEELQERYRIRRRLP